MNRLCALALICSFLPLVARAQVDTAATALARTPHFAAAPALDARPGVFAYRFDAPGWPETLSIDGLPPAMSGLRLDALPFDDLVTGQARFDLLPLAWLDTLSASAAGTAGASLRRFEAPRPRTEVRYLSGPNGFQSVEAVHAQSRRRMVLGREGQLDAAFGYAGRAADNEYPNSRLRRGRATLARLGFDTGRGGIEVFNLHTRSMVGAPGGVLPPDPADPGSIYDRFNATVRDRTARRQTIRNDTGLRVRRGAVQATLYRTFERLRYSGDSLTVARIARYGVSARAAGRRRAMMLEGWWQRPVSPSATDGQGAWLRAEVEDTLGPIAVRVGASYGGTLRPEASLRWKSPVGIVAVAARAVPVPAIARRGFGVYASGAAVDAPLVVGASVDASRTWGDLRITARPFIGAAMDGFDYTAATRDSLVVGVRDVRRAGAALDVGWREASGHGLYAQGHVTATANWSDGDFSDLPPLHADMRLGLRTDLFRRDLRVDLFARVRAWSAFDGRVLHGPTGLLVLPAAATRVPGSATLDVTALGHVRVATLFLTYENALSGTALMRGNLVVPEYPLPARRLRFGVFWPIFD